MPPARRRAGRPPRRFEPLGRGLALLLTTALVGWPLGCGKAPVDAPVTWYGDLDVALAAGKAQDKPIFVYFGADWDSAAKELEHVTFVDSEVSWLLRRDFVSVRVDTTDDEAPQTREPQRRFKVVGDPTLVLLASDGVSELARFYEFVDPPRFARALRAATRPGAAEEAHFATLARKQIARARDDEERRRFSLQPMSVPTVTITFPPLP